MAPFDAHLPHRLAHQSPIRAVRYVLYRAARALSLGQHDAARDLLLEADALEAAIQQYERAIAHARAQVDDLRRAVGRFWDDMADDRTLHDLADDASVFLLLVGDLDHAESRLLTLEHARP